MIKIIFVVFFYSSAIFAELIDLGVHGNTTNLKDGFDKEIENRYKKVDKKKLLKDAISSIKRSLYIKSDMPECKETKQREFYPTIILKQDVVIPIANKRLFKKGDKVNLLEIQNISFPFHMLFIDYDNSVHISLSNALNRNTQILIVRGDISEYAMKNDIRVARKEYELKSFDIKCLPSLVTQSNNKFIINEYSVKDLTNGN